MSKQMIVNVAASEEMRVAIVENRRLIDLDVESESRTKHKGNIYKGIVANVEDSLEAAFIEFGDDKQGFLALSEVRPSLYPSQISHKKPKISEVLTRGQEIIVQVTKDEIGAKGAAVTTYLSLPGRYVVLMHSDDGGGGVSRKIEDEAARRRARDLFSRLEVPPGLALIIRTAGMNKPVLDLVRDLNALSRSWEQIDRAAQLGRAPTLLYREPDLVIRTIRDYFAPDISEIVVDDEDEFEDAKSYVESRMPERVDIVKLHTGKQPIFEQYGIERAIEELFQREVKLPSGGSIVIDQAEALVAVDVNSGRSTREDGHEQTVYKTNMEAAREIARQLRLRDLGGIIVVDFIDMVSRRHERDVERAIREAMRDDKARIKIGHISENGTLEITRQRLRQAHRLISYVKCSHCEGTGSIRDPDGLAVSALRTIHGRLARSKRDLSKLSVRLPVEVANVLNNGKRRELVELADEHQLQLDVIADARLAGQDIRFEEELRGRAGLDAAQSVKDPRLTGQKRGRRTPTPAASGPTIPPPSIGPVPRLLVSEEELAALETMEIDEELPPESEPEVVVAPIVSVREHFDDLLAEVLFGAAPEMPLEQAEIEAPPPAEARGRKKRRRRRRRGGERGDASDGESGEGGEETRAASELLDDDAESPDESRGTKEGKVATPTEEISARRDSSSSDMPLRMSPDSNDESRQQIGGTPRVIESEPVIAADTSPDVGLTVDEHSLT